MTMPQATKEGSEPAPRYNRSMRSPLATTAVVAATLASTACETIDPKEHVELVEIETYWAIERSSGQTQYLAPVARVVVKNRTSEPSRGIQATATFRRVSEPDESWGSAWEQVARISEPLAGGESVEVIMKSDGRYYSTGRPESFFEHELFRDATVDIFLRVGSSTWVKFEEAPVERRIGREGIDLPPP